MAAVWPNKKLTRALLFGFVGGLAGVFMALSPWGQQAEERFGLDWLFQLRGPVPPPDDVIIVAIDKTSSDTLGVPYDTTRWPRTLHARLLDGLRTAGARVVTFDLLFRHPRNGEDDVLARAMVDARNVALLEFLEKDQPGMVTHADQLIPVTLQRRTLPTPKLAAAAAASGPFTLPKVPDRVSRYWTFDQNAGGAPSLPVVTLALHAATGYAQLRALSGSGDSSLVAPLPPSLHELVSTGAPDDAAQTLAQLLRQAGHRVPGDRRSLDAVLAALRPPLHRFLNFYGPPQTLTTLSYAEVLQRLSSGRGAERFAGKAVFVGVSSPVQWHLRDEFRTVYSDPVTGLDLSGSEILATGFANLLQQNSIRPFARVGSAVNVLLWGLLVGLVAGLLRPLPALVVVSVAAMLYLYIVVQLFAMQNTWSPVFVPLAVLAPLMLFGATLWHYREARADLDRIRITFGHYLPPAMVDRLVQEGFRPLEDRRTVFGVCLMTDAEGYTAVAAKLPSDRLVDLVNDYLDAVIRPIRALHGEVSDIKGDSVLAFWASRQDDLAIRSAACRALGDIQQAVDGWNAKNAYDVCLPTRVGLHCGSMTLASVGAADHYEQRAVGDIVNTASRLEQLNKELGTRLLVSAQTVAGVEDAVTRYLGKFTLKGRNRPLEVHEYLGWGEEARADVSGSLRDFSAGVEAFENQQWDDAAVAFNAFLKGCEDDPVALWYLGRLGSRST